MWRVRLGTCTLVAAAWLGACGSDDPTGTTHQLPVPDGSVVDSGPIDAAPDQLSTDTGVDAPVFDAPKVLSTTGLFSNMVTRSLAPGVMPFDVRYPVWHDGATSERFLYLPPGAKVDTFVMDIWQFPIGTKAWKEFYVGGKLIETRYAEKRAEASGGWLLVSYLWNEAVQDGNVVPQGVPNALGTTHDVPDVETCGQCHNGAGDVIIGVSAIQSSKETGGGFLATLMAQSQLSDPPAKEFPMPGDGLVEDVLGYLHGNCAHCHNDTNWLAKIRKLRYKIPVDVATPEATPTYQTNINALMNHLTLGTTICVLPGDPGKSQLYVRMNVRGDNGMPFFDTKQVDDAMMPKIAAWITGLK